MGQCVLRDCGFKFEKPDREADLEKFLIKKATIKFPFKQSLEDENDEFFEKHTADLEPENDLITRVRPAAKIDRGVQTIPVELEPEELNYYRDHIQTDDHSPEVLDGSSTALKGNQFNGVRPVKTDDSRGTQQENRHDDHFNSKKQLNAIPAHEWTRDKRDNRFHEGDEESENGSAAGFRVESDFDNHGNKFGIFEKQKHDNKKSGLNGQLNRNETDKRRDWDDEDPFKSEKSETGGDSTTKSKDRNGNGFKFPQTKEEKTEENFRNKKMTFAYTKNSKTTTDNQDNLFRSDVSDNIPLMRDRRKSGNDSDEMEDEPSRKNKEYLGLKTTLTAQVQETNDKKKGKTTGKKQTKATNDEKNKKGFMLKIAVDEQDTNLESKSRSYGGNVQPQENEEVNKSKTEGGNMPKSFDNVFFRKDVMAITRARSPSPMGTHNNRILPDNMSDEEDFPEINRRGKNKK